MLAADTRAAWTRTADPCCERCKAGWEKIGWAKARCRGNICEVGVPSLDISKELLIQQRLAWVT
jgi:hypothetical protein